jgi:hypothetical protein
VASIEVIEYDCSSSMMFDRVLAFCKKEVEDNGGKDPAAVNMWAQDWYERPNTLPFILSKTSRFSAENGAFHLVLNRDQIIACGGVYRSEFDQKTALAGVRTWVSKQFRSKSIVRNYLLPTQKKWAIKNRFDKVALSFNHYNQSLISLFTRGQKYRVREQYHLFSSNFHMIDQQVIIQNVPQYVIYEDITRYTK